MKLIDAIASEFEQEVQTTRRHLERLPDDRLDWRPHEKSFTARGLSSHIVECVGWTGSIFSSDEFDFTPTTYEPYLASSVSDLLKCLTRKWPKARAYAASCRSTWPARCAGSGFLRTERQTSAAESWSGESRSQFSAPVLLS